MEKNKTLKMRLPESRIYVSNIDDADSHIDEVAVQFVFKGSEDAMIVYHALIAVLSRSFAGSEKPLLPTKLRLALDKIPLDLSDQLLARGKNVLQRLAGIPVILGSNVMNCQYKFHDVVVQDFLIRTVLYCATIRSTTALKLNIQRAMKALMSARLIHDWAMTCTDTRCTFEISRSDYKWMFSYERSLVPVIQIGLIDTQIPKHLIDLYGDYV